MTQQKIISRPSRFIPKFALTLIVILPTFAQADDRIRLRSGGEVAGTVVSEEEQGDDKLLTISLASGGSLKLLRSQIGQIETTTPEELAYAEQLKTLVDTPDGHFQLALWCEEQRLRPQQEYHLLQVIKLDPEHEDARHDLGYSRIRGEWATRDQILRRDGRLSNGMLFEEFEIERRKDDFEARQTEYIRNLRVWRKGIGKTRHAEMLANIQAVEDPAAVRPIVDLLSKETSRDGKMLWLETLAQIRHPDVQDPLIQIALLEEEELVRSRAINILKTFEDPSTQRYFMVYLDPAKYPPSVINRAGRALVELGNREAVRALIESVVTSHKVDNPNAGSAGAISPTFDNQGGGSFKFGGGGPKTVTVQSKNEGVRSALQEITGVDYQFDKAAWMNWYSSQQIPVGAFDLRRSN